MVTTVTVQQIIEDRISFLKEQINLNNKPELNSTFQIQIDAITTVNDYNIEKVGSIIQQKKTPLKNSEDVSETDRLFAELEADVRRFMIHSTWKTTNEKFEENIIQYL